MDARVDDESGCAVRLPLQHAESLHLIAVEPELVRESLRVETPPFHVRVPRKVRGVLPQVGKELELHLQRKLEVMPWDRLVIRGRGERV